MGCFVHMYVYVSGWVQDLVIPLFLVHLGAVR